MQCPLSCIPVQWRLQWHHCKAAAQTLLSFEFRLMCHFVFHLACLHLTRLAANSSSLLDLTERPYQGQLSGGTNEKTSFPSTQNNTLHKQCGGFVDRVPPLLLKPNKSSSFMHPCCVFLPLSKRQSSSAGGLIEL